MNTYFNEITEKPVQSENGKILYKIPFGAFCGNGDLGIVFDNEDDGLLIHISKCDFWKFTPGAHKDGGIKTVGSIKLSNVDLSDYNIRQFFDKGLFDCTFSGTKIECFVAPKISIGAEVNLSLYYVVGGQQYVESEMYNTSTQAVETSCDLVSPGDSSFRFGTENLGGSLYMAFYF